MEVTEDSAVNDFLEILEEHRRNCERQGKYVEAEIAKNRLDELKLHEENRRKEAMRSRQIAERLGVEEAHMLEFQQFNKVWDKRMADFEHHAEDMVFAMRGRHGNELRDFQRNFLQTQPRPKFSCELLDLRRIQEHLAKAKHYADAHEIKLKADALEAWEMERWRNKRQADFCQRESKFKHGKAQEIGFYVKHIGETNGQLHSPLSLTRLEEMAALLQRVMAGRDEQKKQRQMDLERLLQRYQNVKSELEAQQKLERIRTERYQTSSLFGRVVIPPVRKKVAGGKPSAGSAASKVESSGDGPGESRGGRRANEDTKEP